MEREDEEYELHKYLTPYLHSSYLLVSCVIRIGLHSALYFVK